MDPFFGHIHSNRSVIGSEREADIGIEPPRNRSSTFPSWDRLADLIRARFSPISDRTASICWTSNIDADLIRTP